MFKAISKMEAQHQIAFAVLIGVSVISFWRGVWGLMDEYLIPHNYRLSLWASMVTGVVVLIVTQKVVKELM